MCCRCIKRGFCKKSTFICVYYIIFFPVSPARILLCISASTWPLCLSTFFSYDKGESARKREERSRREAGKRQRGQRREERVRPPPAREVSGANAERITWTPRSSAHSVKGEKPGIGPRHKRQTKGSSSRSSPSHTLNMRGGGAHALIRALNRADSRLRAASRWVNTAGQ